MRWIILLILLAAAAWPNPLLAQEQGRAEITDPVAGSRVRGIVPVVGTASHPTFQRYELAFAYDPDPTGTWFTIQDPLTAPVTNGPLGRWDTSGVTDGVYALRLRVYGSERTFIETIVRGVRIQNTLPTPTATLAPTVPPEPTATLAPTVTAAPLGATPLVASRPSVSEPGAALGTGALTLADERVTAAFWQGARLALAIFGILGLYVGARTMWRRQNRR